jgi:hypothetical protein
MKLLPAAAMCTLALAAAGCGDGDDEQEREPATAARLEVVVRPAEGKAPVRRVDVACSALGADATTATCRRLGGLSRADLAPVPEDAACAQIYGGPAVATVTGTLRGRPVDARFDLRNACEIERWRRNATLLGPAPERT